jgi:DNA-binding transcriptional MerR regulator
MLKIGQLAGRLGLNPRTIRFYEQAGVLPAPERTESGYRLYGPADEERLRFVKTAQRLGLTLGEIKEIVAFRDRGQPPCRYVTGVIERRLAEINERMRELRALGQELGSLRERMRAEGLAERDSAFCHYIEQTAPAPERRSAKRR